MDAGRILKVDHAGEHGAVSIYTGQIWMARFTAPDLLPELRQFREHERSHRARFQAELIRRGIARCRSYWLCAAGGLLLGLITGSCGRHAIAATTAAVERVVLDHLELQVQSLRGRDEPAVSTILSIIGEERAHYEGSVHHLLGAGFWSRLLQPLIAFSTEAVIWIGMRI